MAVNGRNLCTGNSRHINITYFLVMERVDKKGTGIYYCPTHLMLTEHLKIRYKAACINYLEI